MTRYDTRSIHARSQPWLYGCALLLALACGPVAADVQSPAFERFRSQVVGNTVNFSYGGAGTPLGGAGNATGIGVASGVDVSRSAKISTKHGPINGTLIQKLSSGALGKAMGRLASAGRLATPLGIAFLAAPFVIDWLTDAGLAVDESGAITKPVVHQQCRVSWAGTANTFEASSCQAAAQLVFSYGVSQGSFHPDQIAFCIGASSKTCGHSWGGVLPFGTEYQVTQLGEPTTVYEPVQPEEIEEKLSSYTNPSPEALAELYKLAEPLNFGHPIPDLVDTLRAEFEARSPESTTTETTDTPTETKTEEKKCATHTQVVANVLSLVEQCATTTTTQAKDPVTGEPVGEPITSTKTTVDGTPQTQEETEQEDPCIKNPTRVGCSILDTQEGEIPTAERTITYAPENVGLGSGTCPAPIIFTTSTGSKSIDVTAWCDVMTDIMRPLFLLIAAFSAFFIVAPVWSNPS